MADPGFPAGVGGVDLLGGRGPPTQVLFTKMYVKMKELGPVGGGACARHALLDPPRYYISRRSLQWAMALCYINRGLHN